MVQVYSCESDVTLLEEIGSGAYGVVYKGELAEDDSEVAIKIMKRGNAIKELQRMRKLDHPNIVKLLGFVPKSSHDSYCGCTGLQSGLWLVMEYMPGGNLQQYVSTYQGGLEACAMEKIAYQIAVGMDYLHRTANLVHRDLAARNILVDEDNNVKIADFGLCDDYYGEQYYYMTYGKPCPVRSMPPENMPDNPPYVSFAHFSRKGDVWSYGVVLYEIWSRGKTPFDNLSAAQVLTVVKSGKTVLDVDKKFQARFWVMQIMKMCFQFDKTDRPNFRRIYKYIEENSEYDLC